MGGVEAGVLESVHSTDGFCPSWCVVGLPQARPTLIPGYAGRV